MPPRLKLWHCVFCVFLAASSFGATDRELKPLSPRDIFPATADNLGEAARERMVKPAPYIAPDRIVEFAVGVGVPYLANAEVSLQLFKRWQVGAAYGLLPSTGLVPTVNLPSITQTIGGVFDFRLDPVASTSLTVVCPFIRYFPKPNTFYFQLTWGLLLSHHRTVSGLTEVVSGAVIPGAEIVADIDLTTSIPTISIGHFFWRHAYFLNVSLGATFLLTSSSRVKLSTTLPPAVGAISAQEEASIKSSLDAGLASAIASFRDRIAVLPSIMISTGLMF